MASRLHRWPSRQWAEHHPGGTLLCGAAGQVFPACLCRVRSYVTLAYRQWRTEHNCRPGSDLKCLTAIITEIAGPYIYNLRKVKPLNLIKRLNFYELYKQNG